MSIVEWAHLVLPLGALFWGGYLAWRYSAVIDRWADALDKRLSETEEHPSRDT